MKSESEAVLYTISIWRRLSLPGRKKLLVAQLLLKLKET